MMNDSRPVETQRRPIREEERFAFDCHQGLACFTNCCRNTDMYLYPYDILRMKQSLGISSQAFLEQYTDTAIRNNPCFPNVMLKMSETTDRACFFLTDDGCRIYPDRPFSCRAYPMERGVSPRDARGYRDVIHFVAVHSYCKGHGADRTWTVQDWIENQAVEPFLEMNDRWTDLDALFRTNPWGEPGLDSRAFKMAFMASYNLDGFRDFLFNSSFLQRFPIPEQRIAEVRQSETELLKLGFDWITFFLTGKGPLQPETA